MQFILSSVLIGNLIRSLYFTFKQGKVVALVFFSAFSITYLSIAGINSGKTLIVYTILALALFIIVFKEKNLFYTKISLYGIIILLSFFIVFLISYLYSPAASSSYGIEKLTQLFSIGILPALIILGVSKFKDKELMLIENFILFACFATSLLILGNFLLGGVDSSGADFFNRYSVGDVNPIWISRFLSLGLLLLHIPRFEKYPFLVFSLSSLLLFAAILTGSKIVLFFTIPIILMYKILNGRLSKRYFWNLVLLLITLYLLFIFLNSINSTAFLNRFSLESGTINIRESLYQTSLHAVLKSDLLSQLFGHGGATIGESLGYGYIREYPHNIIIELLYEVGLLGILIFLLQFVFAAVLYFKGRKNWIFFAYILHLLFSLTSGDLTSNTLIFVFFSMFIISEKEKKLVPNNSVESI